MNGLQKQKKTNIQLFIVISPSLLIISYHN